MKMWLKKFFKGTYLACQMLLLVALGAGVLWGLTTTAIWLVDNIHPSPTNLLALGCGAFVVIFGLLYSTWD